MKYILDSTAIIECFILPKGDYFAPPEVFEESKSLIASSRIELLNISFKNPSKESVNIVLKALKKTKDKLSKTDINVISLALDLNAIVVSDDYGVQNTCAFLGVNYFGIAKPGIKKVILRKK